MSLIQICYAESIGYCSRHIKITKDTASPFVSNDVVPFLNSILV